jgi:photosystem II stability/assembly factor-like uncharacterized protein
VQLIRFARRREFGLMAAAGAAVALAVPLTAPAALSAARPGGVTSGHLARQSAASVRYSVGPIRDVSVGCPGTGDISEAVDRARDVVYQEFEGCDHGNGIGFARSADGGHSYTRAVALPGSNGGWDPSLAVAPDGTLYAAFMNTLGTRTYPVIDVSHDYGRTFDVERSLRPAQRRNWGDAEYLTVGSNGTLYVAWGYGPSNSQVKSRCSPTGSCWAYRGDVNVAAQRSTDEAKTFTPISVVNPGYPDGGADEGDVTVAPDGAVDVLYQGYEVVNRKTLRLAHGHEYFTTSADGGKTWSVPVKVGASAGQMTINEWWNDGAIATDSAGDLYATWDTQGRAGSHKTDIGWVSFSRDGGREWSAPVQATPDHKHVPHITEVAGAGPGNAYVAWLSSSDPRGYALYLRTFSIRADGGAGGWLSNAVRISRKFGNPDDFPGDTFGIATFSPAKLAISWGSAVRGSRGNTSVFAAPVRVTR